MAIVQTKYPVLHDSRHVYSSVVELEIVDFKEVINGVMVTVEDYFYKPIEATDDEGDLVTVNQRTAKIPKIIKHFTSQEVDALASAVQSLLPENPTESERRETLKNVALLHFVQTDMLKDFPDKCIYYTDPEDWEIKISL